MSFPAPMQFSTGLFGLSSGLLFLFAISAPIFKIAVL